MAAEAIPLEALVAREGVAAVFAVAGMGVSVMLQGRGHRREEEAPAPFDGAVVAGKMLDQKDTNFGFDAQSYVKQLPTS